MEEKYGGHTWLWRRCCLDKIAEGFQMKEEKGSKVTVTNTGAGGTTGATVTVAHGLGVAPRGVAVVPISQFNGVQAVVLPASISTTQFVISVAVAPSTGPGTWVFEVVVFP
jgi:hypothetical protein